jgi:hypothetical protein
VDIRGWMIHGVISIWIEYSVEAHAIVQQA